jgi:hypothetical protein
MKFGTVSAGRTTMKNCILFFALVSLPMLCRADEPANQGADEARQNKLKELMERSRRVKMEQDKAESTVAELRAQIGQEIKALGKHPWAGEYYQGDGLGANVYLSIAPKAGYVYEWRGCVGLYDRNYGTVAEKDGRLRVSFMLPRTQNERFGVAEELVQVAWGERKYLVPTIEFVAFCNEVNRGREPRDEMHGFCFLRRGDDKKKVTGLPSIPKEFEPYLLKTPIETEIVAVGKPVSKPMDNCMVHVVFNVTLKHGKRAGLLPGMELRVVRPENVYDDVQVKSAENDKAEGVISQYNFKRSARPLAEIAEKTPAVGWKLSTRDSWRNDKETQDKKTKAVGPERVGECIWPAVARSPAFSEKDGELSSKPCVLGVNREY